MGDPHARGNDGDPRTKEVNHHPGAAVAMHEAIGHREKHPNSYRQKDGHPNGEPDDPAKNRTNLFQRLRPSTRTIYG